MIDRKLVLCSQICVNSGHIHTECCSPAIGDPTVRNQLWRNEFDAVGRNRETNPISRSLKLGINSRRGRHPDQIGLQIHQRTTTISRVDGGVGLNGIRNGLNGTVESTDDPVGHGLGDAQRIANRQHFLPDPQLGGISQGCHGQPNPGRRCYLHHRQIIRWIGSHDLGCNCLSAIQDDLCALGALYNMIVRDNVTFIGHNHTGAQRTLHQRLGSGSLRVAIGRKDQARDITTEGGTVHTLAGCREQNLLDQVANVLLIAGNGGAPTSIEMKRIINLHHIPFTRTCVMMTFSPVPVGTHTATLSRSRTGMPPTLTRTAATTQLPVTHGPLLMGGGGNVQPATT